MYLSLPKGERSDEVVESQDYGHCIVENAMVSPFFIPGVGDEPIVLASLVVPTEDLDGVTAQIRAANVVEYSKLGTARYSATLALTEETV